MAEVLESIRAWLSGAGVPFVEKHHEPTHTSEESAAARGEPLQIGAKALVMKVDDAYRLFVLPASLKVDSQAIKKHFNAKKLRFADRDELLTLTGLVPGCVPPFGPPVVELPLVADPRLLDNDRLAFNAGSLTDSIIMSSADYQRVSGALWLSIAVGS